MAINYDALPSVKPSATVPAGFYKATITAAEMRTSKNTGNTYLALTYDLNNVSTRLFCNFVTDRIFIVWSCIK